MLHIVTGGVIIPKVETLKDCITLVKSDFCRYTGNPDTPFPKILFCAMRNPVFGFHFWFRLCQYRKSRLLHLFFRFKLRKYHRKYFLDIPTETAIGYGLYIGHGQNIVINETAVIGNNVNLGHYITIGSNKGKAATIEDGVLISPSVCVVEDIRIGHNTIVGAGAVVTKSLPPQCSAAGVPAKVLHSETAHDPRFAYPLPEFDQIEDS